MKRMTILLALLTILLLLSTINAMAMSSTNYALDWYTPLTGVSGGTTSSANYAIDYTVGQSAIGASDSANFGVGLGFWNGIGAWFKLNLPLIYQG
jgi:hypothetical protein